MSLKAGKLFMAKPKIFYECSECGHQSPKWLGLCPSCGKWHTFEEGVQEQAPSAKHKVDIGSGEDAIPLALADIAYTNDDRVQSGISELDRVLGGGFMPGSILLLGGDPGIGKSTLTLEIAKSNQNLKMLYVAGEESASQIKQRADRVGLKSANISVYNGTEIQSVIEQARKFKPDLLVIDSIQTVYRRELSSLPGSIQQIRECAALLQQLAKKEGVTTLMIGHVTKEGDIAGPRILEHMVDTVLQFEGDPNRMYRLLRSVKNRFGPAQEVGVFEMNGQGLQEITNPSNLFLSDMDSSVSGNAVTCIMEGSRPLLIEVQALVTPGSYGTPQRTASGFDQRRLALLLAVLEKRAGIQFAGQDVYLNIAGGIRITDTAADLAVICALASSHMDKPLLKNPVIIGEVGLGGEIRKIPFMDQRIKEAEKLGFERVICPDFKPVSKPKPEMIFAGYVAHAIKKAL
jgi:DNA repair protein RadA/Sms